MCSSESVVTTMKTKVNPAISLFTRSNFCNLIIDMIIKCISVQRHTERNVCHVSVSQTVMWLGHRTLIEIIGSEKKKAIIPQIWSHYCEMNRTCHGPTWLLLILIWYWVVILEDVFCDAISLLYTDRCFYCVVYPVYISEVRLDRLFSVFRLLFVSICLCN